MSCNHLSRIRPVQPVAQGCPECTRLGMSWVELRMCLSCGHVGCCERSEGRHAEWHSQTSGHPLVRSFQQGQDWTWCYEDACYVDRETVDQAVIAARRLEIRARTALVARPFDPYRPSWMSR